MLEPGGRGARGGAVPGRGEAPDDRVVGPDHLRVLRRHRGRRPHADRPRRSGWRTGFGRRGRVGEIHIVGDDGEELPTGEVGVVLLRRRRERRSSTTTIPRRPRQTFDERGWARCGDIGYLDDDGYLYLTDRLSLHDRVRRREHLPAGGGGLLLVHPKVADVAVFGVPDAEMGEQVKAVVQPADGRASRSRSSRPSCWRSAASELAHYKCPRSIDFDRRAAARRQRQALQARPARPYWEGHDTRLL